MDFRGLASIIISQAIVRKEGGIFFHFSPVFIQIDRQPPASIKNQQFALSLKDNFFKILDIDAKTPRFKAGNSSLQAASVSGGAVLTSVSGGLPLLQALRQTASTIITRPMDNRCLGLRMVLLLSD